ncbi:MAG: helix-turn-helix domain-containing protein [Solirubrobacterales bacterium]|nr:helix-turn-helix domain-containing protein [Solirubrobacterales bacterium]
MDVDPRRPDPLSQPTRARLFELLGELRRPAGTDELARMVGLHPNGVRIHLDRLRRAGLVDRRRGAPRRGRPRDEWTVASAARPGGGQPAAYRDLVRWLARATPAAARNLREIESAGREIGADLAPPGAGPTPDALRDALAALGFDPELERHDGGEGAFVCRLGNCPYRDAVRENQPVICALHRGITQGLLDALDPSARLARFEPRDPDAAGCLIEVRGGGQGAG